MKTNCFPRQFFFFSGLAWGGIFIRELLAYPELWFFVCFAAGAGSGFLLCRFLPERFRSWAEFVVLTFTALSGSADLYSALLPAAFGMSCANTLCRPATEWHVSRRLCGGILLGAVLIPLVPQKFFMLLLLFCVIAELPEKIFRFAAVMLALFVMYVQPAISVSRGGNPAPPPLAPGTMITALSLTEPAGNIPQVVITGGNEIRILCNAGEIMPAGNVTYAGSLSGWRKKADLILSGSLLPISDGGISRMAAALNPGGLLVIPVEMTGALPAWHWYILPGSRRAYAIGSPGRELKFDPDKMDATLQSFFPADYEGTPIAGALAGMLVDERFPATEIIPWNNHRRMIWIWGCAVLLLILGIYVFCCRMARAGMEYLRIMLNCGGYAFMAAAFLPVLFSKINMPFIPQLLCAITVIWFLRRPAENRRQFSRFQGVLSVAALLLTLQFEQWWILAAALFSGGYAYAQLDNDLRTGESPVEPLRFMAAALGICAVCLMNALGVPELYIVLIAAAVRFYSWFRN